MTTSRVKTTTSPSSGEAASSGLQVQTVPGGVVTGSGAEDTTDFPENVMRDAHHGCRSS